MHIHVHVSAHTTQAVCGNNSTRHSLLIFLPLLSSSGPMGPSATGSQASSWPFSEGMFVFLESQECPISPNCEEGTQKFVCTTHLYFHGARHHFDLSSGNWAPQSCSITVGVIVRTVGPLSMLESRAQAQLGHGQGQRFSTSLMTWSFSAHVCPFPPPPKL